MKYRCFSIWGSSLRSRGGWHDGCHGSRNRTPTRAHRAVRGGVRRRVRTRPRADVRRAPAPSRPGRRPAAGVRGGVVARRSGAERSGDRRGLCSGPVGAACLLLRRRILAAVRLGRAPCGRRARGGGRREPLRARGPDRRFLGPDGTSGRLRRHGVHPRNGRRPRAGRDGLRLVAVARRGRPRPAGPLPGAVRPRPAADGLAPVVRDAARPGAARPAAHPPPARPASPGPAGAARHLAARATVLPPLPLTSIRPPASVRRRRYGCAPRAHP
ncbi:hypothetical protein EES46_28785 [Streptomyces sp. ADI98-10]|nr:hypothetical protein EES46_28785 [Streptomyces sp. ADI98-10]